MSRRPLGAAIPPHIRLVVFEQWIRDVQAAIDELEDAVYAIETGRDFDDDRPVSLERAWRMHHSAFVDLQILKGRGFRAPKADLKRSRRP